MTSRSNSLFTALLLAAFAGAVHADGQHGQDIGKPGLAAEARRTVQIDMSDAMRFTPSSIDVKQGETVRFIVKNSGRVRHELVLGTEQGLKAHGEAMRKNPGMEHADENMVTVDAGKTGELVWQFTKAGRIEFACLQPGHFEAGMKGVVKVAGKVAGQAASKGQAPKEDSHADHKH
ncbi:MAG TPA: cupredoxin family protein [Burkholderiaceae bacterium]|nr:cupredoxin family protein [Burkholderiaceae bacterium]